MTRTFDGLDAPAQPAGRASRPTPAERAFVLFGVAAAAVFTAVSVALGAGTEVIGPAWLAALAWTVLASLACALARGIRRRDWSAFRNYELPDGRGERIDWVSKTGRYAYLREWEDRHLH